MQLTCPTCAKPYPPENINVQTDVAHCPACNQMAHPSELMSDNFDPEVITAPPPGAWYSENMNETVVGATTRSPVALFMVPFMCVWSGFSIGGIYGSQIASREFNLMMSLFGLPFVVGSILFWSITLMAIWGKSEVRLRGQNGEVFVGIGSLGWKRRFNFEDIDSVDETLTTTNYPGRNTSGNVIELSGKSTLRFGSNLSEPRRYFMLHALRAYMSAAKKRN